MLVLLCHSKHEGLIVLFKLSDLIHLVAAPVAWLNDPILTLFSVPVLNQRVLRLNLLKGRFWQVQGFALGLANFVWLRLLGPLFDIKLLELQ